MEKQLSFTQRIRSLEALYIVNNGYWAALTLLLPFLAKDLGLNLGEVGILSGMLTLMGIVLAIPASHLATKIGGFKILVFSLLCICT